MKRNGDFFGGDLGCREGKRRRTTTTTTTKKKKKAIVPGKKTSTIPQKRFTTAKIREQDGGFGDYGPERTGTRTKITTTTNTTTTRNTTTALSAKDSNIQRSLPK